MHWEFQLPSSGPYDLGADSVQIRNPHDDHEGFSLRTAGACVT
jgi:hypothetical protein